MACTTISTPSRHRPQTVMSLLLSGSAWTVLLLLMVLSDTTTLLRPASACFLTNCIKHRPPGAEAETKEELRHLDESLSTAVLGEGGAAGQVSTRAAAMVQAVLNRMMSTKSSPEEMSQTMELLQMYEKLVKGVPEATMTTKDSPLYLGIKRNTADIIEKRGGHGTSSYATERRHYDKARVAAFLRKLQNLRTKSPQLLNWW